MSDQELYARIEQLEALVVILAMKDGPIKNKRLRRFVENWQATHSPRVPDVEISVQSMLRRRAQIWEGTS